MSAPPRDMSPRETNGEFMPAAAVPGLVSVIIPAYNRAGFIAAALDSVLAQTYRPIECLVVDDGSTDDTGRAVAEWGRKLDAQFSLRCFRQENRGAAAARNRGLRESRGEFINFLDSDDRLLPKTLQRKVECLRSTGAPYCYVQGKRVDGEGNTLGLHGRPWTAYDGLFFLTYHFDTNAPLIRRSVCQEVGPWDESLKGWDEVEYFARLKLHGGRGVFLEEVGHLAIEHNGDRITPTEANEQASYPAREAILATILKAGPQYAHEAAFLRGWLMLTHARFAAEFSTQSDYRRALASLRKAHQFGYSNWHLRAILALNRRAFHPASLWGYFSLRRLIHEARRRVRQLFRLGGTPDPIVELYRRRNAAQDLSKERSPVLPTHEGVAGL